MEVNEVALLEVNEVALMEANEVVDAVEPGGVPIPAILGTTAAIFPVLPTLKINNNIFSPRK